MVTKMQESIAPTTEAGESMAAIVREAWAATELLGTLTEQPTRESAFMLVLEAMLRGGSDEGGSVGASANGSQIAPAESQPPGVAEEDDLYSTPDLRIDGISNYLEIERESVDVLFDVGAREPSLQLQRHQLSNRAKTATREIALLILGARTALGLDTSLNDIREVVKRYRKYDGSNFAAALKSGSEFAVLGQPRSSHRTVRLRGGGMAAARELAKRLVSE